jgi:hypothetical protein
MTQRWIRPLRSGPKPIQDEVPTPFAGIWSDTRVPSGLPRYPDSGMERKRVLGWEVLGTILVSTMRTSNNSR